MDFKASEDDARRKEQLNFSTAGSVRPPGRIHFQFGPQKFPDMKLGRDIDENGMAEIPLGAAHTTGGKLLAHRGLDIEISPPFAQGQCGLDDVNAIGKRRVSCRRAELQETRDDVIAGLFIRAQETIFEKEHRPVCPSFRKQTTRPRAPRFVGWNADEELSVLGWYELDPLAAPVIDQAAMRIQGLRKEV